MGDYEVTFPDGNVYYIDKESSYYWGIMREEEAAGSAAAILNGMGITDTEEETLDLVSTVPMHTLVDAPDAKYQPGTDPFCVTHLPVLLRGKQHLGQ